MALNSNFRTLTADNIEGIVDDRNYLKSSFENGTITGWTEVAVALTSGLPTGTPTIGATAASSLALSATSVTPLSGSRSLLVDVPSALTAGHGFISDEFTLDRMDLGKVLTVSFDYERITGTYNFSGTLGSQTWMVYIYDATLGAANWIQPAGFLGMNQSSGPGRVRATFQSSVTAGQKYRVAVIASQAASGASSIEFDNFTCSRQTAPIGPVVTDYTSFTGSWLASVTNPSIGNGTIRAWVARVGDSARIRYQIVPGSTTTFGSGDYYVMLPSGLTIDTNKSGPLTNGTQIFGSSYVLRAGVTRYFGVAAPYFTFNDRVSVKFQETVSGVNPARVSSNSAWSPTIPATLQNGDEIDIEFEVPISGWSSNVQLSNDTDTRVVAFKGLNIVASIAAGSQDTPKIIVPGVARDTHGTYNTSTGAYTIPVSGFYRIIHRNLLAIPNGNDFRIGYAVNTTTGFHRASFLRNTSGLTLDLNPICSGVEYLNAGETVYFCCAHSSGSAINLTNDGRFQEYSIERLSGPSVMAASETVAAGYWGNSAQSIPVGVDSVCVSTPSKVYDTHNMWSAGSGYNSGAGTWTTRPGFTIPVSGKYLITFSCGVSLPGSPTLGTLWSEVGHLRGASVVSTLAGNRLAGNFQDTFTSSGSGILNCQAGDFVGLFTFQSTGAARNTVAESRHTRIEIVRIGN